MILIPKLNEIFLVSSVIGVAISFNDIYLFHIVFGFIILFSIRNFAKSDYKIDLSYFSTKYIYFFPIFFGWYFLSIFWSINKIYTIQYLFYIFCGLGIVFSFVSNINDQKKLKRATKIIGLIFGLEIFFSILEALTSFRLPISPFSDVVTLFGRETSLQPSLDSFSIASIIQPPTGFQWNPNDLAVTMIMLVPFFLFLNRNIIKWIAIIAISIIIIMTSSRTVLLSMGLLFFVYFIFYKKQIMSVVLVIMITSLFFTQIDRLKESENAQVSDIANTFSAIEDVLTDDLLIGQSLSIRQELARNGIQAIQDSYGLGVGGGGSIAIQERLGGVDGRITSMHNFWLEIIVDSGILFATLFFLWYISLAWDLFKLGRKSKNKHSKYLGKSISLSMIIFIPAAISASSVIYFLPMWLLFGFAIATLEIESKLNFEEPQLYF